LNVEECQDEPLPFECHKVRMNFNVMVK